MRILRMVEGVTRCGPSIVCPFYVDDLSKQDCLLFICSKNWIALCKRCAYLLGTQTRNTFELSPFEVRIHFCSIRIICMRNIDRTLIIYELCSCVYVCICILKQNASNRICVSGRRSLIEPIDSNTNRAFVMDVDI